MIPCVLELDEHARSYRRSWAKLIQTIYEADPPICQKCQGEMRIISFIEGQEVVKAILKHLGLWLVKRKPQPKANAAPTEFHLVYSVAQIRPS